ncbi:MAG: insulinase family protein [Myxococcales bacterium]|nr:insulinase family protein [Myxococcales bacterium]
MHAESTWVRSRRTMLRSKSWLAALSSLLVPSMLVGCPKTAPTEPIAAEEPLHKPPLDDRAYRYVALDNGLDALVISDADTDMAAAAMDVHVGQFSDPPDREGLAHFLEHMLFMGTDKYPDVDGYRDFVQSHGGRSNAGTSTEHTRYHFQIEHAHLEEALDRFAQFFTSPVLDPEYVQREREAVNSEYKLKVQEEARRFREVRRKTSNPEHGFSKFSVGNLDTLADREGAAVWDALKAFYDAEYSASRMSVSVIGREDLDTLEGWVRERFSAVTTTGEGPPVQQVPPFRDDQLGVRIHVTPLSEVREVRLEWLVPSQRPHFREHPLDTLSYLVGQEGEGSLHAVLTERGWITSLSSGQSGADDHGLLTLRIPLTEEGYAHVDDVVDIVFQYMRLMTETDDLQPWWEQNRALAALNFQFAEPPSAVRAVQSASSSLRYVPPEHVLDWWATYSQYDAELQRSYLEQLRPERVRLFVVGPDLQTDQVEERYDVPWSLQALDPELVQRWATSPIDPALKMPAMNPYIAEQTALHPVKGEVGVPTQVVDEDGLEIWHLLDPSFGVPRSTTRVSLVLPHATTDMAAKVHARVFSDLVDDSLSAMRDQLRTAGMTTFFGPSAMGMTVSVRGYDDKQHIVLERLLQAAVDHRVDPERFAVVRDDLVRRWRNLKKDRSIDRVGVAVREAFDPTAFDYSDAAADYLQTLSAEELQRWLDGLFDQVSVRMITHGNHTADEAIAMGRLVQGAFEGATTAPAPPVRVRRIPADTTVIRDVVVDHDDSAIQVLFRSNEQSPEIQAQWLMLSSLVRTPAFTQLRTEQQLGYIVWSRYDRRDHLPGLGLAIQSNVADPNVLLKRITAFLEGYADTLAEMSDEEFETVKSGLVANLEEAPDTLYDLTNDLIRDYDLAVTTFDRKATLVEHLRPLSRDTVLALLRDQVLGGGAGRLIVRAQGKAHTEATLQPAGCADAACVAKAMGDEYVRER